MVKRLSRPQNLPEILAELQEIQVSLQRIYVCLPQIPLKKITYQRLHRQTDKLTGMLHDIDLELQALAESPLNRSEIRRSISGADESQIKKISEILKEGKKE